METYTDVDEGVDFALEEDEIHSEYERERGKPMPSFEHALVQSTFCGIIREQFKDYIALSEISLKFDDFKPVPDVAIYPKQMVAELRTLGKSKVTIPPILTVEILSPKQALSDLFDKAKNFLAHGVPEAWIIVPEIKSITVFRPNAEPKTYISGNVNHHTTEIIISIEELFAI